MHITCPIPGPYFRCALQVLVWKQYTLYPSSLTLPMYIHILSLKFIWMNSFNIANINSDKKHNRVIYVLYDL